MDIDLTGIVIVVGNYGSGKSEVSINLAINRKRAGIDVRVADLDLVNPYFRAREVKSTLDKIGIEVVMPSDQYFHADLPILSPQIGGIMRNPGMLTIFDAGGDDVGATVLAALADHLRNRPYRMLQVVNNFRPYTDSIGGCLKIGEAIESAAKLKINGIVGNANLIDETQPEHIYEGYEFVRRLSDARGVTLEFITLSTDLMPHMDMKRFSCPVLPLERQLVPPWKRAVPLRI
jgi:hypothetical protein